MTAQSRRDDVCYAHVHRIYALKNNLVYIIKLLVINNLNRYQRMTQSALNIREVSAILRMAKCASVL